MRFTTWNVALLSACLSLSSYAALAQTDAAPQGPPPGGPRGEWRRGADPERQLHMLTHLLTLSAEQQTGVKALLVEQDSQMKALHNQQAGTSEPPSEEARAAMRAKGDQIREETNTKISALLDEAQKKTFADWQAQRKEEMAKRAERRDNPPPPPPNE